TSMLRQPRPTTVRRWRSPPNSAGAPLSPTATSASASSAGARATGSRRRSISLPRRRCTVRWGWRTVSSRRKRRKRRHKSRLRIDRPSAAVCNRRSRGNGEGAAMRALASLLAGLIILAAASLVAAGPEGQITWAEHTTLVPAWLDPGEAMNLTGALYALHDALVKPMPGGSLTPSLAESWSMSPDGLVYDFVLRKGVRFHNGEPVTAEDVKFSFERYRGGFASVLKDHVARVETVNPGRVRIRLTDTGERLRPSNVWFSASSRTTRHARAALKRGEVDIAYFLAAEDIRRTPGFMVKATLPSTHWLYFLDQWDPKSPWHDRRVRLAANYAIDRHAINRALTRGLSRITWSIVHSTFDLYW